ncbi:MAG: hypothetical protein K1X78_14430 [Verrucomicrobiaceae bacterium]|nr:hypothetical protein [Verrucomicrobiaceae bacterium]
MKQSSNTSPRRSLARQSVEMFVLMVMVLTACIASAQTFQGDSAYQQLIRDAGPSGIVEVNGQRYVRAPQGVAGLPGGYSGAFEKRKIALPNGQEIEVIDPTKPLRITKDTHQAQPAQLPERGMKIVAAMEKMGLHPKTYLLPKAIGGYRISATTGEPKPGRTFTELFIHIGEEAQVKTLAKLGFPKGTAAKPTPTPQIRKAALSSPWAGEVSVRTANDGLGYVEQEIYPGPGRGHDDYLSGWAAAFARRGDVVLHAKITRWDSLEQSAFYKTLPPIKTFSKFDAASGGLTHWQQRTRYMEGHYAARCIALSTGLDAEAENWLKMLAKIVDDVDRTTAAPAVAATTPPKPTEPAKDKPKPTARVIFGKGPVLAAKPPPRPGVGERLQNWWEGVEDYAADNPNRWAGWCLTSSGTAVMAVSLFVPGVGWTAIGAGLFACGVGAYHGGKAQPPPEVAIVTEARERLQRYQQEWKHGFTDAELNELGIFMDDLSKLTPAQRRQVYKDADVEFTTRAEAFRQMREDDAKQGRPGA